MGPNIPGSSEHLERSPAQPDMSVEAQQDVTRRSFLNVLTGFVVGAATGLKNKVWGGTKEALIPLDIQKMNPDIAEHLKPNNVKWTTAREVLEQQEKHCIDGRCEGCAACTPGGDAGDLLLQLAAVEEATGEQVTKTPGQILDEYFKDHKGGFYVHTDGHAIEHAAHRLHLSKEDMKKKMENPPEAEKEKLLEILADPACIGCGHLRLMLQNPQKYPGIRPAFVKEFVKELYRRKWKNDKRITIDPLEGNHDEKAVLVIKGKGAITEDSQVPLIQPNIKGHQIFVIHPQIEELSEKRFIGMMERLTGIKGADSVKCLEKMRELRSKYLASSAGALAKGKPVLEVVYNATTKEFAMAA